MDSDKNSMSNRDFGTAISAKESDRRLSIMSQILSKLVEGDPLNRLLNMLIVIQIMVEH